MSNFDSSFLRLQGELDFIRPITPTTRITPITPISSFYFIKCSFTCLNQFLTFWVYFALYTLKKLPVLYACQLIFCNLYVDDSEKRHLYIKQLIPLAP